MSCGTEWKGSATDLCLHVKSDEENQGITSNTLRSRVLVINKPLLFPFCFYFLMLILQAFPQIVSAHSSFLSFSMFLRCQMTVSLPSPVESRPPAGPTAGPLGRLTAKALRGAQNGAFLPSGVAAQPACPLRHLLALTVGASRAQGLSKWKWCHQQQEH